MRDRRCYTTSVKVPACKILLGNRSPQPAMAHTGQEGTSKDSPGSPWASSQLIANLPRQGDIHLFNEDPIRGER